MTLIPAALDSVEFERLASTVSDPMKLELIQITLSCGVPFIIHDLQQQGGPDEYQLGEARAFAFTLGASGDAILYRIQGKTAEMMDRLIECIAILAFCPGGITTFGLHFQACSCVHSSVRTCSDERLLYGICACPWCHRAESEALS